MLVIRRRVGESILIGDCVEIQVTEIGGSRVKLGITAPKDVLVLRKEVQLTREENVAAAQELALEKVGALAARLRHAKP